MLALSWLAGTAVAVLAAQAPSYSPSPTFPAASEALTTATLTFLQEKLPTDAAETTATLAATPAELAGWYNGLWLPDWRRMNRSYFAWSAALRRGGEPRAKATAEIAGLLAARPSTETIAAIVAAREAGLDVPPRTFEAAVAMADSWRSRSEQSNWGPDVLLARLEATMPVGPEEVPERLLGNMANDDVEGNANTAMELFYAGMQVDPDRFVPVLHGRWKELERNPDAARQERICIGNLILLRAQTEERFFLEQRSASRWSLSEDLSQIDPDRVQKLPSKEQNIAIAVAEFFAIRSHGMGDNWWDGIEEEGTTTRERAWRLLETYNPLPTDVLLRIARHADANMYDQRHALMIMLLREPGLGRGDEFGTAFARSLSGNWGRAPRRYSFLFGDHYDSEAPLTELTRSDFEVMEYNFGEIMCTPLSGIVGRRIHTRFADIAAVREALVDHVVKGIAARENAAGQVHLARFLLMVDRANQEHVIADTLVGQFADDDVWANASEADYMLNQLSETPIDALRVGFEYGVQTSDWQLIRRTAEWLSIYDPTFRIARPQTIEFMAAQLRDDDVDGNCAAATAYLNLCVNEARSTLQTLTASSDGQQARRAARILQMDAENSEEEGESEVDESHGGGWGVAGETTAPE